MAVLIMPQAAIVQMIEAIVKDQRKVMPIITYLQGEYQVDNACIGVPVVLGSWY